MYTCLCMGPFSAGLPLSGSAAQWHCRSAALLLAALPLAALPHRQNSGWYFKSLKYLCLANRVGFRVSRSGPHGSCGRVKHLYIVSLGSTDPDRLVPVYSKFSVNTLWFR